MKKVSAQDTLFIDMKYIVLYRKIGFDEIDKDIYLSTYGETSITIESENQRFLFNNQWYSLISYKDMVKLECVDRLLKKGYKSREILINQGYDIILKKDNKDFLGIIVEDWGFDYNNKIESYTPSKDLLEVIYTSRLTGGLIEFKYKIYKNEMVYDYGFFERNSILYNEEYFCYDLSEQDDNPDFEIKNNVLIKYIGNKEKVTIPNGVLKIGTGAFWNNLIVNEILIPKTVTCIAGDAFVYCENLKTLKIPVSVFEIGDNPFAGCVDLVLECDSDNFVLEDGVLLNKERTVIIHYSPNKKDAVYVIPETVQWLGKHSFYKCNNLMKAIITKNVSFVGNNVFSDCENIVLENKSPHYIYINGLLCNSQLTDVYHYSIGSKIINVTIPEGIRTIGRNSFWNARDVKSISIPSTVRQIGYNPFAYCLNAKIKNSSPRYELFNGLLYSKNLEELICCTSKMAENEVVLPNNLISIGRNAFTGCENLNEINLVDSLKYINRGAFSGCINLIEISIPLSVISIGDWAFNNCVNLKLIWLPYHLNLEINALINCPAKVVRY